MKWANWNDCVLLFVFISGTYDIFVKIDGADKHVSMKMQTDHLKAKKENFVNRFLD